VQGFLCIIELLVALVCRQDGMPMRRRSKMLRTLEAEIDQKGAVRLLEPVQLAETRRALVTILDDSTEPNGRSARPFGLCAGEFIVPEHFDEPLSTAALASLAASS
jgi:hypothetical protein